MIKYYPYKSDYSDKPIKKYYIITNDYKKNWSSRFSDFTIHKDEARNKDI